VVPTAGAPSLTLEALRTWARERLAPWKLPRALEVVEALPRNAMGKVDKTALRALFEGEGRR
jgi:malonyl-CoA/methylmalonyl-CoA synthetase